MNCPKCNCDIQLVENAALKQELKGEALLVHSPAWVCANCGFQILREGQADELRRRTADAYRRQHGLLTSADIKACRKEVNMTQEQFAQFLGVSAISIKRWETWQVQEPIYDRLIREKCGSVSPAYERMVSAGLRCLFETVHEIECKPEVHLIAENAVRLNRKSVTLPEATVSEITPRVIFGQTPISGNPERRFTPASENDIILAS